MNNLQNSAKNNQSSATFNFSQSFDFLNDETKNQLSNLAEMENQKELIEEITMQINHNEFAVTALYLIFDHLSNLEHSAQTAENLKTWMFPLLPSAWKIQDKFTAFLKGEPAEQNAPQNPNFYANSFKGMYANEVTEGNGWQEKGYTLRLVVRECDLDLNECELSEQPFEVIESEYIKRNDSNFSLEVITAEQKAEQKAEPTADTKPLALMLSEILNHPDTPIHIYNGIADGINETFNDIQSKERIADSPEYIGLVLSVYNETEKEKAEAERAELLEKHKREAAESRPLDLSEMSAESLGTNDRLHQVAECFSGILQDESLPELLRDGVKNLIVDSLFNESKIHDRTEQIEESTEYIEALLKDVAQNQN